MLSAFQQALAIGVAEGMEVAVTGFAEELKKNVGDKSDLANVHKKVATEMQDAVLVAYDQSVAAHKKVEQRNSPARYKGKLRDALAASNNVVANADGFEFMNMRALRQKARHVGRLNWGAQGYAVSSESSPAYPLRLFGAEVGQVSFREQTRPAFALPPGLFFGQGVWTLPTGERRGTGAFYPLGEIKSAYLRGRVARRAALGFFGNETRGIRPRYFLEAGLEEMTRALPREYNNLVQDWMTRTGGQTKTITIKPRPRRRR